MKINKSFLTYAKNQESICLYCYWNVGMQFIGHEVKKYHLLSEYVYIAINQKQA